MDLQSYLAPELPEDEADRQVAVDRSGVLGGRLNRQLQQVVDATSHAFDVPIAAVTIIDRGRQWFAARVGMDVEETARSVSFCAHAILRPGEAMVVGDAASDRRFSGNPLVRSAPNIRFYAGMPLVNRSGYALGALCMIDSRPRTAPIDLFRFGAFARQVEAIFGR